MDDLPRRKGRRSRARDGFLQEGRGELLLAPWSWLLGSALIELLSLPCSLSSLVGFRSSSCRSEDLAPLEAEMALVAFGSGPCWIWFASLPLRIQHSLRSLRRSPEQGRERSSLEPRIDELALEGEKGGEDRFLGSAPDLLLGSFPFLPWEISSLPPVKHSVTRSPQISDVSASPSRLLHRIVNGSPSSLGERADLAGDLLAEQDALDPLSPRKEGGSSWLAERWMDRLSLLESAPRRVLLPFLSSPEIHRSYDLERSTKSAL